jgi:hypothetical protein
MRKVAQVKKAESYAADLGLAAFKTTQNRRAEPKAHRPIQSQATRHKFQPLEAALISQAAVLICLVFYPFGAASVGYLVTN